MKLNFNQLDNFFNNFPSHINICLFIGSDNGQITIGTKKVRQLFINANINAAQVEYDYSSIKDHHEILLNEFKSRQLFGDNKIIVIKGLTDSVNKDFLSLIDSRSDNNLLILQAQDTKKTSKLYKLLDKNSSAAVISCYKYDPQSLSKFITGFFAKNSIQYERDLPEYLSSIINMDLLLVQSELEKLIVFCDGKKITREDVDNLIVETSLDISLFDLCHSLVIRDKKLLSNQLSRIIFDNINFIMVVRVLQNYFFRMLNIKTRLSNGENINTIMSSLYPPVFFKDKDKLVYAAGKITLMRARVMFKNFVKLEIDCKRSSYNPQMVLYNALLKYIN